MRCILLFLIAAGSLLGCSDNGAKIGTEPKVGASRIDDGSKQDDTGKSEMRQYPSPDTWGHANDRQRQRALRSFEQLKKRNAPVYPGPLFVDDEEEVKLQTPKDVARRTLVLWAVELRAEGIPREEALQLIDQLELWDSVSPEEKRFLQDDDPDPDESQQLVWRLESIWVLLWALGYIEELEWPSGMCDVPKLVEILKRHESNSEVFD